MEMGIDGIDGVGVGEDVGVVVGESEMGMTGVTSRSVADVETEAVSVAVMAGGIWVGVAPVLAVSGAAHPDVSQKATPAAHVIVLSDREFIAVMCIWDVTLSLTKRSIAPDFRESKTQ